MPSAGFVYCTDQISRVQIVILLKSKQVSHDHIVDVIESASHISSIRQMNIVQFNPILVYEIQLMVHLPQTNMVVVI